MPKTNWKPLVGRRVLVREADGTAGPAAIETVVLDVQTFNGDTYIKLHGHHWHKEGHHVLVGELPDEGLVEQLDKAKAFIAQYKEEGALEANLIAKQKEVVEKERDEHKRQLDLAVPRIAAEMTARKDAERAAEETNRAHDETRSRVVNLENRAKQLEKERDDLAAAHAAVVDKHAADTAKAEADFKDRYMGETERLANELAAEKEARAKDQTMHSAIELDAANLISQLRAEINGHLVNIATLNDQLGTTKKRAEQAELLAANKDDTIGTALNALRAVEQECNDLKAERESLNERIRLLTPKARGRPVEDSSSSG